MGSGLLFRCKQKAALGPADALRVALAASVLVLNGAFIIPSAPGGIYASSQRRGSEIRSTPQVEPDTKVAAPARPKETARATAMTSTPAIDGVVVSPKKRFPSTTVLDKPVSVALKPQPTDTQEQGDVHTDLSEGEAGDVNMDLKAMVVVDPYSSGGVLARKVHDRGYKVVRVLSQSSQSMIDQSLPAACQGLEFATTIQDHGDVEETIRQIKDLKLDFAGVLCGAEPGVELFDSISSRWGEDNVWSNGEELSHHRRDKYLMGEKVREAGLRAVKQMRAATWEQVESFVAELYPNGVPDSGMKVILKPVRSSSSEDVYLAESMEEVRSAFDTIKAHKNQYGEANEAALVQEYLSGQEYVVNCVSRDGEHKVVSYWKYDKRRCNGSKFVYFSVNLFESEDGKIEERLAHYIRGVLGALNINHGPSHAEVMWLENEDQPCLVEIGCRPHGGDGVHTELAQRCIGYNQIDTMIDLYDKPEAFDQLPAQPERLKAHASVVTFVSRQAGLLRGYPGHETVKSLKSYQNMALKLKPGDRITKTVDYLTNPGWAMLVHEDAAVVRADAALIHEMEENKTMYDVEEEQV